MITWAAIRAFLGGAWGFLRAVPWQAWLFAVAVALGWYYGHIRYEAGRAEVRREWDESIAKQDREASAKKEKQAQVSERVVTRYVDRVRTVREKGETIIKEVPVYVPVDSPDLPPGFRVLYDAAAKNELPDPARIAQSAPVAAQDVAASVADNFTICHENEAALDAILDWHAGQAPLTR